MRFHLQTLGCRLNEAELSQWTRHLLARGHAVTTSLEEADVAVLNSCAVTTDAARSSRKSVRRIHRENPRARIVVTGCLATLEPESVAPLPGVDLVVPNLDKDRLVDRMLQELLPGIINQLGPDNLANLKKIAESYQAGGPGQIPTGDAEDDEDVPDLVDNFEETAAK